MRQTRITHYLGVALVLYLVAHAASFGEGLDPVRAGLAGLGVLLSLVHPFMLQRAEAMAGRRIGLLGLAAAVILVSGLQPHGRSLALAAAGQIALAGFAGLLSDLALAVPGRLRSHSRLTALGPYLLAVGSGLCGLASVMPPVEILGRVLLVRPWLASIAPAHAALAIVFALGTRLLRRWLGGELQALAANTWALLGLLPAAALTLVLAALQLAGPEPPAGLLPGACLAAIVILVVVGHVLMADGRRQLNAGPASRDAAAAVLAVALVGMAAALLAVRVPEQPVLLVLAIAAAVAASAALFRLLRPLLRRLLAPYGGKLLDGIEQAIERMACCQNFDELGRAVLQPMRASSGDIEAEPLLFGFNPLQQARIDAAGEPHLAERELSPAVYQRLREAPGEILIRRSLEALIVRQPPLRPVVDALEGMDALCVVPLCRSGELEGALLIPRGRRRSALTLEEVAALGRFSLFLTAFVALLSAEERARRRVAEALTELEQHRGRADRAENETARLHAQSTALKAAGAAERQRVPPVAYSDEMRELMERLREQAAGDAPVLLVAEAGLEVEALAYQLHSQSERASEALVTGDCAAAAADRCGAALFGDEELYSEYPGWLPLAGQGTLLLLDLPALPPEVQRSLGWAMSTGQASRLNAEKPYPTKARIIATSRVELAELVAGERFDPRLAGRFQAGTLRVPPLRQRAEDLPSILLGELSRACRIQGREPLGIEADAARALGQHDWPGNIEELRSVIERAVAVCDGPRVRLGDLPAASFRGGRAATGAEQLAGGTFEALEKRILQRAIDHARGNKSEAARALGLKRTTFLDKLKRHGIAESKPPAAR